MEPFWFLTALVMALHKDMPADGKAGCGKHERARIKMTQSISDKIVKNTLFNAVGRVFNGAGSITLPGLQQ